MIGALCDGADGEVHNLMPREADPTNFCDRRTDDGVDRRPLPLPYLRHGRELGVRPNPVVGMMLPLARLVTAFHASRELWRPNMAVRISCNPGS